VSNPSWTPTGAASVPVNHGFPRCTTWWAIHHMFQTYSAWSAPGGSLPVRYAARGQVTAIPAAM